MMLDTSELDLDSPGGARLATPSAAPAPRVVIAPTRPPHFTRRAPGLSRSALREWLVEEFLAPIFRPLIAVESVWQWADRRVVLNPAGTGRGGTYESWRTPWARRFQESFTADRVREHHMMKCSRSGFTEAALNIVRFMPEHAPGPVHFAAGSEKKTKEINKDRLVPTLRRLGIFADDGTDPDDITATVIRLQNMVIRISGSYTEGSFRADGNRVEILDEVELVNEIKGAGTLHDLGRSRIRGVRGARLFTMSKPLRWGSAHHREVVTGSLDAFLVPCPHCGTFQELSLDGTSPTHALRLEDPEREAAPPLSPRLAAAPPRLGRLRFDHCKDLYHGWDHHRLLAETTYQCINGCDIVQDAPLAPLLAANAITSASFAPEVHEMLAAGRPLTCKQGMAISGHWLATNPRPIPGKRSGHVSDLYSLDDDMTWGHFASIFVQSAHDPARLRTFNNENMGMPHRDRAGSVGDEHIAECRGAYARGMLPFLPDLVTICADTQDAWWKYVVAAARLDSAGQAWRDIAVVDWGHAPLKSDLLAAARRTYALAADPTRIFSPSCGLIDAGGHRTDEVYELHFDSQFLFFPSYGRGGQVAELRPTWQSPIKEAWRGATFNICWYWDDHWKRRLYLGSLKRAREIKNCTDFERLDPSAKGLPPRLWLPGLPADAKRREFELELRAEQINDDGEWETVAKNDFGDALKQCYAMCDFRLPATVAARVAAMKEAQK